MKVHEKLCMMKEDDECEGTGSKYREYVKSRERR